MKFYEKIRLLTLKAKIKGLAEAGKRCNKLIQNSSGDERNHHRDIKKAIGNEARYHLIAYGLIRGLDYGSIEPNSNKEAAKYMAFDIIAQICQRHCLTFEHAFKGKEGFLKGT